MEETKEVYYVQKARITPNIKPYVDMGDSCILKERTYVKTSKKPRGKNLQHKLYSQNKDYLMLFYN